MLAGTLLPFAFAPFYLSVLAFIAPALLLYTWIGVSPPRAMCRGFLFGIGFFTVGISWVYISIHVFGDAPIPLALLISAFFIGYLSLFVGLQGYCLVKLFPQDNLIKWLLAFPCSWVTFEALRGWLFTGFPWLLLGYSQSNTWLKGYAPILGVYGLSLLTAFFGAMLLVIYRQRSLKDRLKGFAILLSVLLIGGLLSTINWTHPVNKPQQATLIQGNIEQALKWQPDQVVKTLKLYVAYTEKNWASHLIIWPEAAITLTLNQASDFLASLDEKAKKNRSAIITGIPIINPGSAFNGMIAIGNGKGVYHKRHLVPFGEYTPLKPFWSFIVKAFDIPMSNFQKGQQIQPPLIANGIPIAPYICYEVAYPIEFLTFLPQAQLLLTITDDSWFGHSLAPKQHLQMAQFRAMETGRYLLFSSNTGITAIINAKGEITKLIPPFQEAELTATVQPMEGITPWMVCKTYPLLVLLLFTLFLAFKNRVN